MKSLLLKYLILFSLFQLTISCKNQPDAVFYPENILNYQVISTEDETALAFSDQGAWFAYGFPIKYKNFGGFSGPFLLTQENGVWCSPVLSQLQILNVKTGKRMDWSSFTASQKSFLSHMEQTFENEHLKVVQKLFFISAHSAFIQTRLTNKSNGELDIQLQWEGSSIRSSLQFSQIKNGLAIQSLLSTASGFVLCWDGDLESSVAEDSSYRLSLTPKKIKAGESIETLISQSFIFPEYSWEDEKMELEKNSKSFSKQLKNRVNEKQSQLQQLYLHLDSGFQEEAYKNLVTKCLLTLQNNWRVPAGEIKHSGLFPSYHYEWFNGFWAWDSWKHAAALAQFDPELAKNQIRAMYDYINEEGFIVDCIYRDTSIEKHNERNTKPPLSAWAVWKIYEQDGDLSFLAECYPKIVLQHIWWYQNRDHDRDGLCEYGSTDGSLVAAKWESGMDNAVRFDESKILQNSITAWSLDQESVDLNCYLFAEKKYLVQIARQLGLSEEADNYELQSHKLKNQIQSQFFDSESGWFYDTSIEGKSFVKIMASSLKP